MKRKLDGKTLLVLGNGFDLYCGLPSDYESYFKFREKQDDIQDLLATINNVSNELIFYKRVLISGSEEQKNWNMWDIMFFTLKSVYKNDGKNEWSYVEDLIKRSLDDSKAIFKWKNVFEIIAVRKGDLPIAKDTLVEALVAQILCFHYKNIDRVASDRENYLSFLLSQLKEFELSFGEYIYRHSSKPSYVQKSRKTILQMANCHRCIIESFNYTLPHERTISYRNNYSETYSQYKMTVIHLNGDTSNPVFGIGSTDINVNDDIFRFTKIFRNMEKLQVESPVDEGIKEAIIFGHSLNEQDYPYFFSLFDVLGYDGSNEYLPLTFLYSNIIGNLSEQEIKTSLLKRIIKLFDEYEKIHLGRKGNNGALITNLKHQNLIKIASIQDEFDIPVLVEQ